ncbi:hypothetical protein EQW78_11465 [Oerskovia turbata]|uniref:Uncharacterized protein n=1 Tax=Oerskovia turbata TaxID=1713 RepID=A0A4Q1KTB4_9CELL|nr:hypothetical protein [Oerskovia turbata]RXR25822.1 hypothetical protein EQW73_10005 [Oerskovia turbata]RXR33388.1 hypothetical protein EQW78_11465 [Oerskovia turbata]
MEHEAQAGPGTRQARRRRSPRTVVAPPVVVAAAGVLTVLLAACVAGTGSETCVSWASFADDAARTEQADLVVDATVVEQAGTRSMFGAEANVWSVDVGSVAKGDAEPGERLEVVSTPPTCSSATYPEGDPLDADGEVRLYLKDAESFHLPGSGDGWALITPLDGVGSVP